MIVVRHVPDWAAPPRLAVLRAVCRTGQPSDSVWIRESPATTITTFPAIIDPYFLSTNQAAGTHTLDDATSLACLGRTGTAGGASDNADCNGRATAKRRRGQRSNSSHDGLGAAGSTKQDDRKRRSDGQSSSKPAAWGHALDATSPACGPDGTAKRQCTHESGNSKGTGGAVSNTKSASSKRSDDQSRPSSDASTDEEWSSAVSEPSEMGDLSPNVGYWEY